MKAPRRRCGGVIFPRTLCASGRWELATKNGREGGLRPRDPEWETEMWVVARARELEREMGGSMMKGV